jgi:glutamyl-tRNA reductase
VHLYVVGVNHSTTTVAIREKLAISAGQLSNTLASFSGYAGQGVILSTCNRTEVYTTGNDDHNAEQDCIDFLLAYSNIYNPDLRRYLYIYRDKEAIEHLHRVASGLDSMIIGEFEILGQVGRALEAAEKVGMVNLPLRNLFRNAIRTGRMVRGETLISRNALSVSSVAVDLAMEVVGNLSDCRILVIGAGEAGILVAKAIRERGARHIAVIARSKQRASNLAAVVGGRSAVMSNLGDELSNSGVVISCTGSPHLVLDLHHIKEAMETRPGIPLVIIDIAVPRDVEPAVGQLNNVFLYNIDHLTAVSESNRELREKETRSAGAIVETQADKFFWWLQALKARSTVSDLVRNVEQIRQRQLDMTIKKLHGLSDDERDILEAMTKAIVNKILHEPIKCLKENAHNETGYTKLVRSLFSLDGKKQK